jgi:hypothetical protein
MTWLLKSDRETLRTLTVGGQDPGLLSWSQVGWAVEGVDAGGRLSQVCGGLTKPCCLFYMFKHFITEAFSLNLNEWLLILNE